MCFVFQIILQFLFGCHVVNINLDFKNIIIIINTCLIVFAYVPPAVAISRVYILCSVFYSESGGPLFQTKVREKVNRGGQSGIDPILISSYLRAPVWKLI